MSAYYSIVQYVPDEVSGERINIGVVAFDHERVQCRFLRNWSRVRCFVHGNEVSFLKDVANDFSDACSDQLLLTQQNSYGRLSSDLVSKVSQTWRNTIQITEPRGSLLSLEDLLPKMADRFLRKVKVERPDYRGRHDAKMIAARDVNKGVQETFGSSAKSLVKLNYSIDGAKDRHPFDVSIVEGDPFLLVHGLSFEGPDSIERRNTKGAIAWAIRDVRDRGLHIPLAVLTLPPKQNFVEYNDFLRLARDLGADVVREDELIDYTENILKNEIPPEMAATLTAASEVSKQKVLS